MRDENSDPTGADTITRGRHLFLLIVGALLAAEITFLILCLILDLSPIDPLAGIVLLLGLAFLVHRGYGWARNLMGGVVALGGAFGLVQVVDGPGIATGLVFVALSGVLCAFAWILFTAPSLRAYQLRQRQRYRR